jgi:hypothetical protein
MKVDLVTVAIRYSKQLLDGSHKTVELGAEGTLDAEAEDWQETQAGLYHQLGDQMHYVFSANGAGKARNGPEKAVEAPPAPPLPPPPHPREHYCQEHQTVFKKYEKDGKIWYSHRGPDGQWHRET